MRIFLGLGANLPGDAPSPAANIRHAVAALQKRLNPQHVEVSRLYRSPAYPPSEQPDYINAVMLLVGHWQPETLLETLLDVELSFGRQRTTRWAARSLDIDMLAVDQRVIPERARWQAIAAQTGIPDFEDQLVLPHPRMHKRDFVLLPLAELAPDWRHPVLDQSVSALVSALEDRLTAVPIAGHTP